MARRPAPRVAQLALPGLHRRPRPHPHQELVHRVDQMVADVTAGRGGQRRPPKARGEGIGEAAGGSGAMRYIHAIEPSHREQAQNRAPYSAYSREMLKHSAAVVEG